MFARNEGTIDRMLRVLAGIVLISLVFVGPQTAWGWLGVVPIVTGLAGTPTVSPALDLNLDPGSGSQAAVAITQPTAVAIYEDELPGGARIFVKEPDLAAAERVIEDVTGYPPARLDGR